MTHEVLSLMLAADGPAFAAVAEQLYGALKLRQVPTALVRVPGASHSIAARPSHLIAKTDNIIGWFDKHDPGEDE